MCPYCHHSLGRMYQLEAPHEEDVFVEWCGRCGYSAEGKGDAITSTHTPFPEDVELIRLLDKADQSID